VLLKSEAVARLHRRSISGSLATDFAAALQLSFQPEAHLAYHTGNRYLGSAVTQALARISAEMSSIDWYVEPDHADECARRIRNLAAYWARQDGVSLHEVFAHSVNAIGFELWGRRLVVIDPDLYALLYPDRVDLSGEGDPARSALLGDSAELYLACGHQQNSALQMWKNIFRALRSALYREYDLSPGKWVHVANPSDTSLVALSHLALADPSECRVSDVRAPRDREGEALQQRR
jgi:hypothetical protein